MFLRDYGNVEGVIVQPEVCERNKQCKSQAWEILGAKLHLGGGARFGGGRSNSQHFKSVPHIKVDCGRES